MQCTLKGHSDRESESFADRQLRLIQTWSLLGSYKISGKLIGLRVPALKFGILQPGPTKALKSTDMKINTELKQFFFKTVQE